MEKAEKEKFGDHVREKIGTLKKDIASYKELTKPIPPDNAVGRLSRMEAISSKSINEAALHRAEETLAKLERTLKMLDDPDFGLCGECEEPIPPGRLMAMPEAELCVGCAEKTNRF